MQRISMDNNLPLAYILIVLGHLLMGSELLLPSHGISFSLGVGAIVVGIVLIFGTNASQGLITLIAVGVLMLTVGPILIHYWPKTPMGKRLVLNAAEEDDTMAKMPVNLELEQLRGRYGRTLSALRPSGVTEFDGRRIDTMSEGPMIDPDVWVRCIDVKAGRVIVRQVERPPDLGDLDPNDFRG
jgi:membrane-bound ClpP family serine protease